MRCDLFGVRVAKSAQALGVLMIVRAAEPSCPSTLLAARGGLDSLQAPPPSPAAVGDLAAALMSAFTPMPQH